MMEERCWVYPSVTTTMAAAAKKSNRLDKVSYMSVVCGATASCAEERVVLVTRRQ